MTTTTKATPLGQCHTEGCTRKTDIIGVGVFAIPRHFCRFCLVADSRASLMEMLPEGTTIYCKADSVARSGMSRRISLYLPISAQEGRPAYIANLTGHAAQVLGKVGKNGKHAIDTGIRIDGCGMDMGFSLVDDLSYKLYGKSGALRSTWL